MKKYDIKIKLFYEEYVPWKEKTFRCERKCMKNLEV